MSNWPNDQSHSENKNISQEYYISWAQKAYKHIQEEKIIDKLDDAKINATETVNSSSVNISNSANESSTNTPTWMQKSNRLEALKENATELTTANSEISLEFDKEFVWSAKILADQGRKPEDITEDEIQWLKSLHKGLSKTRRGLLNQLKLVLGQGPLSENAILEIETILLQADIVINATDYIVTTLQNKLLEESLPSEKAIEYLKTILCDILNSPLKQAYDSEILVKKEVLNIWLLTGVNGAGKTTTIGKLAYLAQQCGHSCIIAAAATFRAAAVEQVKIWGEKTNTPIISNSGKNTDPAAVVYDGLMAAQARNVDLLLVDTAGRLQNKTNLMEELAKIRRVIDKKAKNNVHIESLLVIDATLGQNGLRQTELFSEAAHLTGVILTKLDGSSKGGIALAITQQFGLPIRFIGVGENMKDLKPLSSHEFVEALLDE